MKIISIRRVMLMGALCALAVTTRAQVIELRATIDAAQEVPVNASPATGSAIMLYDIGANTFDLIVSISNLANTATASHIHEGAPGGAGPVVTGLGAEAVYTRSGNTLTATFRGITHLGNKLTLLRGGAYFNIHTAQFPGGEVRGRLVAQPKRLVANMTVAQEAAAFPALNFAGLNDSGAAVMYYDPSTNRISLRLSVYNFNNTLTNSHFHEGAPGVSGGVVHGLGTPAAPAAGTTYSTASGAIAGAADAVYLGNPVTLLAGGAYLNFHSNVFAGGELRGQVRASDEVPGTRFSNLSVRGFVGTTNDQLLIQGITVNGPDPIRALITAKGSSLAAFGVAGGLANPRLTVYDSAGRAIASNDDVGATAGTDLANVPGVPTNSLESALLLVLPPGNYSAIVSSATGATGTALLEVNDLRTLNGAVTAAEIAAAAVQ